MTAIGGRSSPEKSSSPNGIWLIRELSLDRAVGAARSSATTGAGGGSTCAFVPAWCDRFSAGAACSLMAQSGSNVLVICRSSVTD